MKLHYWEKQLILYTKGHFNRIDYKKDLKHFPANLYGLDLKQIDQYNILHLVVDLFEKLYMNDHISFRLGRFMSDVFKRVWFERAVNQIEWNDVLMQMLAEIQSIKVLDEGLELGSPDKDLLLVISEDIEKGLIKSPKPLCGLKAILLMLRFLYCDKLKDLSRENY